MKSEVNLMELNLRKAEKKDEKEIGRVLEQGYSIKTVEEGIGVFNEERNKGWNFLVALAEGKVVGIVSWQMKGLPRHGLIELDRIAVLSEFRGTGTAKKLFDSVEENAKKFFSEKGSKLRKLFLFTHEDNEKAISFYTKMGMKKDAVLKDQYYKGKNELVLCKFFSDETD